MTMKLYFSPGACSFVPHSLLETAGADYEPVMVKLHKGEQNEPAYRAVNPRGQVPVLVDGGETITQIVAIVDHLDGKFPQQQFLPRDPLARTRVLETLAWMNNTVHPTFTHVFRPADYTDDETAQAKVKRFAAGKFRTYLERIQELAKKAAPFWLGAQPSFHDAYAFTFLRWGGYAGIDPKSLPAYYAYIENAMQHPAIAAAIARERINLDTYKAA